MAIDRESTMRMFCSARSYVSPHIYCIDGDPRPIQQPPPVARPPLARPHLICRIKKLRASAAECGDPSKGSQTGSICDLFVGGRECAVHTKVLAPMLMNCRDSPPHRTALHCSAGQVSTLSEIEPYAPEYCFTRPAD